MGDKWTLLIVRDLAAGPRRFVELQRVLPGISTEQLRSRLNRMVADRMLTRKRYREVPPRVDYALTERAQELMPVLGELARWGYEWAWGPPHETEAVDVGAIFRLAPGLIQPGVISGTVDLAVEETADACRYSVTISNGSVTVEHGEPPRADAQITGPTEAWIRALSPGHDRRGLRITGNSRLAQAVLDALSADGNDGADEAQAA